MLNGRKTDLPEGLTVTDLLVQKKLNPDVLIVEHNGELLQKDRWPDMVLKENDRLEILRFVGGG
jgi:sulfur carrier protein